MFSTIRFARPGAYVSSILIALTLVGCGAPSASAPTAQPSAVPTIQPSAVPTVENTNAPATAIPTIQPTAPATDVPAEPTSVAQPTSAAAATDIEGIGTVVADYMFKTPASAFALVVDGVSGDIARVTAAPVDFDQTTIFLKKGASGWEILSAGTAFDPDDMAELKIPEALAAPPDDVYTDANPIVAATTYLSQEEKMTKFYVVADASEGDFARVRSISQETDPAFIFLKREGASWKVLTYGTAFSPDDYAQLGIPESLHIDN